MPRKLDVYRLSIGDGVTVYEEAVKLNGGTGLRGINGLFLIRSNSAQKMKTNYKIVMAAVIALVTGIVSFTYVSYKPLIAARFIVMGDTNYTAGNFDQAVSQFTIALWFVPDHALAYTYRAKAYIKKELFSEALSDAIHAVDLLPTNSIVYTMRGYIYTQMGNYHSALKDYKKSVDVAHPSIKAEMLNKLAWFLATCPSEHFRDGTAAVSNARQACELTDWKNYEMLHTLGVSYAASGNFKQAIHWSNKALSLATEQELKNDIQSTLTLFEQGKAYYQEATNAEPID